VAGCGRIVGLPRGRSRPLKGHEQHGIDAPVAIPHGAQQRGVSWTNRAEKELSAVLALLSKCFLASNLSPVLPVTNIQ